NDEVASIQSHHAAGIIDRDVLIVEAFSVEADPEQRIVDVPLDESVYPERPIHRQAFGEAGDLFEITQVAASHETQAELRMHEIEDTARDLDGDVTDGRR